MKTSSQCVMACDINLHKCFWVFVLQAILLIGAAVWVLGPTHTPLFTFSTTPIDKNITSDLYGLAQTMKGANEAKHSVHDGEVDKNITSDLNGEHQRIEGANGNNHSVNGIQDVTTKAYPFGYIISSLYPEQLTRSIITYYQLAEIASHWNMMVVEPHMKTGKKSGLVGLPGATEKTLNYDDYFNVTAVYRDLDYCLNLGGRQIVVTLEDFLVSNATRRIVTLRFLKGQQYKNRKVTGVYKCESFRDDTLKLVRKLNDYFVHSRELKEKAMAVHGQQYKFEAVESLCTNGWSLSLDEVIDKLVSTVQEFSPSPKASYPALTLLLPEWREIRKTDRFPYFYTDPKYSWNKFMTCDSDTIPVGKMVQNAADTFLRSLNLSRPIIGIHIRMERIALLMAREDQAFWRKCRQDFKPTLRSIQMQHHITGGDIVALEDCGIYGSYGRNALLHRYPHIKKEFYEDLKAVGGRLIYYEPKDFGEEPDSGFVSLVEKEFLSKVDHLITIGQGTFQKSLVGMFQEQHHHSNNTHEAICKYHEDWVPHK